MHRSSKKKKISYSFGLYNNEKIYLRKKNFNSIFDINSTIYVVQYH